MKTYALLCSHNGESFIEAQMRSIISQSPNVDELHIFDFNSSDRTVDIARAIAASQGTVEITIHTESDAPGAALSFFRAMAWLAKRTDDADCVFLCDQDDVWLPGKVEAVLARYAAMARSGRKQVAIFHDVAVVDETLVTLAPSYYTGNPFDLPRDLAPDRLLLANPVIGHTLALSGALLKTVMRFAAPSGYLMHDWSVVLIASRVGSVEFVPKALSLYRQHANNVLGAHGRRSRLAVIGRAALFSCQVARQTVAFASDLHMLETTDPSLRSGQRPAIDGLLISVVRHIPLSVYPLLAVCAAVRGPTVRRKLLGVFIVGAGMVEGACGVLRVLRNFFMKRRFTAQRSNRR